VSIEAKVMTEPTPTSTPVPNEVLLLVERFPACFNLKQRRPLKIGISKDVLAFKDEFKGIDLKRVIGRYCNHPRYRKALKEGAIRIDLHGQPAGVVTAEDAESARAHLEAIYARRAGGPPPTSEPSQRPPTQAPTRPSNDTQIPKENLVPGRLELTVKFSELPTPLAVQSGMKLGIHTGEGIVTAILPAKVWRKLEQAAQDYPQWVAALSGSLDQIKEGEITLKHPALQIFEKKSKPTAEAATPATEESASSTVATPTPSSAPAVGDAQLTVPVDATPNPNVLKTTLSLKGKGQKAG
jgi:sRNA-binding protein